MNTTFLETLKVRLQESQAKYAAAQAKMTLAQAEFQAAAQEHGAWQTLVNLETRKEQIAAAANQNLFPQAEASIPTNPSATRSASSAPVAVIESAPANNKSETNKTEVVLDFLRKQPEGVTPGYIWKHLESQLSARAYIYSVLKRLKDRGDVKEKRGKYYFNPGNVEEAHTIKIVQQG